VSVTGYSGKTLATKLGVKEGTRLCVLGAPAHYASLIGPLPAGAAMETDPTQADIIHLFAADRAALEATAVGLSAGARVGASLWISWPKKSSPLFADLTEGGLRDVLLPTGWVDVKVCAVDADWSGLKFLRRRA
jgi:hypothetical protein